MTDDCIFCKIFSGEVKARIIYKDENTMAVVDNIPRFAKGQCVVMHRRHVNQFFELQDNEIAELFICVKKIAQKLHKIYNPEFVCIFSRGQTMAHSHIILYPSSPYGTLDGIFRSMDVIRRLAVETNDESTLDQIASLLKDA
jgi:histidine triad (HIT) family protein